MLRCFLAALVLAAGVSARIIPPAALLPADESPLACSASATYPPGHHTVSMVIDGRTRKFELFVPKGTAATGLLLNFHGYTDTASRHEQMTEFNTIGSDFIQITPNGHDDNDSKGSYGWNAGGCCGGATTILPGTGKGIDDVAFSKYLVEFAKANFAGCFPSKAVFATGFSNGGFFVHRLACEADDVFLGVAAHSGYLSLGKDFKECTPKAGVSILHIHGTSDLLIPFNRIPGYGLAVGFDYNRDLWVTKDTCTGNTRNDVTSGKKWECKKTSGGACKDSSIIEFCKVTGLGHTWSMSADFNSSEKVISFFRELASRL